MAVAGAVQPSSTLLLCTAIPGSTTVHETVGEGNGGAGDGVRARGEGADSAAAGGVGGVAA